MCFGESEKCSRRPQLLVAEQWLIQGELMEKSVLRSFAAGGAVFNHEIQNFKEISNVQNTVQQ